MSELGHSRNMSEPQVRRHNSNPTTRTELTSMKRKYGIEPPELVRRMSARLIEVSERCAAKKTRLERLIQAASQRRTKVCAVDSFVHVACKTILNECTTDVERNELLIQLKRDRLERLIQAASKGHIRVCKAILFFECGNIPHGNATQERKKLLGSKGGTKMETPHYYAMQKGRSQDLKNLLLPRDIFDGGVPPTESYSYLPDDDPESREMVGYAGNAVGSDTTGFSALNRA